MATIIPFKRGENSWLKRFRRSLKNGGLGRVWLIGIIVGAIGGYSWVKSPWSLIDRASDLLRGQQELPGQILIGTASVIDGDTLKINGTRIRLFGIDAPEVRQRCRQDNRMIDCGKIAKKVLAGEISGSSIRCEKKDIDRYGRVVAICRLDGRDLNAWMVEEGLAMAYRQYSSAYVLIEIRARVSDEGFWKGEFEPPWEWRGAKKRQDRIG